MVLMGLGFLCGIISGMGIGGGTVLIPALTLLRDVSQQQAQGVNLLYFVPTALLALRSHYKQGNLETGILKPLIPPGLVAAALGAWAAVGLENEWLRRGFGVFLLGMGVCEICKRKE